MYLTSSLSLQLSKISININRMPPAPDYSRCLFEARLQKSHFLRRSDNFYLYVSPSSIIICTEPYSKKPAIVLELLPTTHVRWLWENKRGGEKRLKGFMIETEGQMHQFVAERVVLEMLKSNFMEITLQSDFYEEYTLGRYIDKGNYAQVYECTRKANQQHHAVKVLEKERLRTMKNGKESVFNELKILRSLKHKNLMRLFEVFEDRNKYYFVLELLSGITLYKEIQNRKKNKEFKPHQIRAVIRQILEGIAYLQDQNIMHRDVKPENILFERKDSLEVNGGVEGLKIVDYGLATYQDQKNVIFTKCGTPGFVAPEVITYDEKEPLYALNVDTFSVGVILHILLVGEQSFPGRSRNTILNKNKECRIDFKGKKYEEIAGDGIDLLSRLLQKQPERRITAKQALNHPFLIKDKPIFKFRKPGKEESEAQPRNIQMKMYHDLAELQKQEEIASPLKPRASHSSNSQLPLKYFAQLEQFHPFTYQNHAFIQIGKERNAQPVAIAGNQIIKQARDDRERQSNAVDVYEQAESLFTYGNY